jgi:hypothetical protein
MKTQALKQALDLHRFDAAFGGARRDEEKSAPKSESIHSEIEIIAGTRKISVQNYGVSSTVKSIKAKVSGFFHYLTGPSWIFGNTFFWKISRLCRCILLRNGQWLTKMAC